MSRTRRADASTRAIVTAPRLHEEAAMLRLSLRVSACLGLALFLASNVGAQEGLIGKIDLMTKEGVQAVKGEWRYHEVTTGVGAKKNELEPKAHGKFDDSKWDVLDPTSLGK